MDSEKLLMVFIKNPIAGHVKTRLAKSVGDEKALVMYRKMLRNTLDEAGGVDASREIWYSAYIDKNDTINREKFLKKQQSGNNLGEKMNLAFKKGFDNGFRRIVIIGSDCPAISWQGIENAFGLLNQVDLVIGPSTDGGYYLLGCSSYYHSLFERIDWSTDKVFTQTMNKAKSMSLKTKTLPVLDDIDTIEDAQKSTFFDE